MFFSFSEGRRVGVPGCCNEFAAIIGEREKVFGGGPLLISLSREEMVS